jgi:predicted TIM-barrel fold metal-dependent hydrolase
MNINNPASFDEAMSHFDTRAMLENAEEQARARHYEDFLIVDVDSHHYEGEALNEIIDRIEDPVLRENSRFARGLNLSAGGQGPFGNQEMTGRITRYPGRKHEKTPPTPHRDITLTRRWMDSLGIDIACLFPTPMLGLALHPQVHVEVQLARAYNQWLCETILAEDSRIKSMLYLPLTDPEAALRCIEEFGERPGVIGFMVTSTRYRSICENVHMKVYAALEERGLPLSFHSGYSWQDPLLSASTKFITAHALGFPIYNMMLMGNWIMDGIPERFPKLKTIWIESGLAWVPFLMQRLDNEYMMRSSEVPALKRLPSDYMRDMFYASQPMEMVNNAEALELTFKMINAESQLLYSSDYPHWDMDLPSTIFDLPFLSTQAKRAILGENARKLFKLDSELSAAKLARKASYAQR